MQSIMAARRQATALLTARSHQTRSLHASVSVRQGAQRSTSSRPRRASRSQADIVDPVGVDLVGPPDPVSNIRPMLYAPPDSANQLRRPEASGQGRASGAVQQPHPYSATEFHQTASSTAASSIRQPRGLGISPLYRDYIDHVCDRVEEADMKLRLSKLTTDSTTQRFWRDNNLRFTRDLAAWQKSTGGQEATDGALQSAPKTDDKSKALSAVPSELAGLSSESDFYSTWLRANATRNKAYNVLVWKQAFDQVRLAARVSLWRSWLKVLRKLEGA